MNKKGQNMLGQAIIFTGLFFLGGIIGIITLPSFSGRFFISGLIFSGGGMGLIKFVFNIEGR
jgi:hypothetical protein